MAISNLYSNDSYLSTLGAYSYFYDPSYIQEKQQALALQAQSNAYDLAIAQETNSQNASAISENVQKFCSQFQQALANNEYSNAKSAWLALENEVINNPIYSTSIDISDHSQVNAKAKAVFSSIVGMTVDQAISAYGKSVIEDQFNKAFFGGITNGADNTSISDLKLTVNPEQNKSRQDNTSENWGIAAGALATGSVAALGTAGVYGSISGIVKNSQTNYKKDSQKYANELALSMREQQLSETEIAQYKQVIEQSYKESFENGREFTTAFEKNLQQNNTLKNKADALAKASIPEKNCDKSKKILQNIKEKIEKTKASRNNWDNVAQRNKWIGGGLTLAAFAATAITLGCVMNDQRNNSSS